MITKNKGENMTVLTKDFYNTMNQVDNKLSEVAKILKSYDSSLNVEDLMYNVYDTIELNVYGQLNDEDFKKKQKNKDNSIVQ